MVGEMVPDQCVQQFGVPAEVGGGDGDELAITRRGGGSGRTGQQVVGCGFPTAHWLALVHFGSGLFQQVIASALRTHDLSVTPQLLGYVELECDGNNTC